MLEALQNVSMPHLLISLVRIVYANGLALLGAGPYSGTVMRRVGFRAYIRPALARLIPWLRDFDFAMENSLSLFIDGLVQNYSNSSVLALSLALSHRYTTEKNEISTARI